MNKPQIDDSELKTEKNVNIGEKEAKVVLLNDQKNIET